MRHKGPFKKNSDFHFSGSYARSSLVMYFDEILNDFFFSSQNQSLFFDPVFQASRGVENLSAGSPP